MERQLLTLDEAAKMLRVSIDTIRRMLKRGELQGVMVSHRWRIYRDSVEKYLKGGST